MRTIKELIENDISRDEMTIEEENVFLEYWYNKYEETGFCETFDTSYTDFCEKQKGQKFEVIERVKQPDADTECLPMWKIKFEDGSFADVYPEEICKLEREK